MRDNGNRESKNSGGHSGQIKPVNWTRTEHQIPPHQGFKPGEVSQRSARTPVSADGHTMRLAVPPKWTHRNDLPCIKLVPKGNAPDPFDTANPTKAAALCAGCPVKQECLADALAEEGDLVARSRWLVRGGLTPEGRFDLTVSVLA